MSEESRDKWKMIDADCRDGENGIITYHVQAFDDGLAASKAREAELREKLEEQEQEISRLKAVDRRTADALRYVEAKLKEISEAPVVAYLSDGILCDSTTSDEADELIIRPTIKE